MYYFTLLPILNSCIIHLDMSNQLDATIAKRFDITVKQNQTFNATITFKYDDGSPVDLSGVAFKMSIREDSCGCNSGCGCIGDSNFNQIFKQDLIPTYVGSGQIQFNDIILLNHGSYKYDLLGEFPDEGRTYLLSGTFKVKKSYTQISI